MPVEGRIRRVLVAARGDAAAERVSAYEGAGIECVVVFGAEDAEDPHLDEAAWACALPAAVAADVDGEALLRALVGVAMDAGADAFDPSATPFAHDAFAARYVASVGLAWLSGAPDALAAHPAPPRPGTWTRCVTFLCDGEGSATPVAEARVVDGRPVVGALGAVEAALAAARAVRSAGVVSVYLGASGEGMGLGFGLPEHHGQVRVGDQPLAVAAIALFAGHVPDHAAPRDTLRET